MKQVRIFALFVLLFFSVSCSLSFQEFLLINSSAMSQEDQLVLRDAISNQDWESAHKTLDAVGHSSAEYREIKLISDALFAYDTCKNFVVRDKPEDLYICLESEVKTFNDVPRKSSLGKPIVDSLNVFLADIKKEIRFSKAAAKKIETENAAIKKRAWEAREKRIARESAQREKAKKESQRQNDLAKKQAKEQASKNQKATRSAKGKPGKWNRYTKNNFGAAVKTTLAINLAAENIPYINLTSKVVNKAAKVSHIIVTVFSKKIAFEHSARITSLACQAVGSGTRESKWRSKYLSVILSERQTDNKVEMLFLTKECRKFLRLLKTDKSKATGYWILIFGESIKRAKNNPNWINE